MAWKSNERRRLINLWNDGAPMEKILSEFPGRSEKALWAVLQRARLKGHDVRYRHQPFGGSSATTTAISLRLFNETLAALDVLARARSMSIQTLIRGLIEKELSNATGLSKTDPGARQRSG